MGICITKLLDQVKTNLSNKDFKRVALLYFCDKTKLPTT